MTANSSPALRRRALLLSAALAAALPGTYPPNAETRAAYAEWRKKHGD